jgi:hypothetical protein
MNATWYYLLFVVVLLAFMLFKLVALDSGVSFISLIITKVVL